jgi:prepilin-type N-terminal cleavage/methylation domain-containing protein
MLRKLKILNHKLKIQNRDRGFTLTEVVMASALLFVVMVPILKALTTAHVSTSIIEHRTNSLVFAQSKLDEIKAQMINSYTDTYTETNSVIDGSYLCNVDESSVNSNLKQITVSVGYDFNGNSVLETDEIDVILATLIARR